MKKIRCAIYTRKSSEDGLEQEFNSLDAQTQWDAPLFEVVLLFRTGLRLG